MAELVANFTLSKTENFDAIFEIYTAVTMWGNISGNIKNQTDLIGMFDTVNEDIILNTDAINNLTQTVLDNDTTINNKVDTEMDNILAIMKQYNDNFYDITKEN